MKAEVMLLPSSAGFARATCGGRFGRGAEPPSEEIAGFARATGRGEIRKGGGAPLRGGS